MFVILSAIGSVATTLHFIFTSLYASVVPLNADILFAPSVVSFAFDKYSVLIVFKSVLLAIFQPYSILTWSSTINSSWSGKWSVISSTYPSISPSLYTLIVYVTTSPIATLSGILGWLYVAVVASPEANLLTSTCGILFVISVPFMFVINFLKLKSNGFGTTIEVASEKFNGVSFTITTGCSVVGASATDQ